MAGSRMLTASGANQHYVGNVDRPFFIENTAPNVLRRIGARMLLDNVGVLDGHASLLEIDREHFTGDSFGAARHHSYRVAVAYAQRSRLYVYLSHGLPHFRSERDDFGELLVPKLAGHRPKDACSNRLVCIID